MPCCSNPIILPRKESTSDFVYRSISVENGKAYQFSVVPCGKCVNCLKNKQSDFSYRIVREAKKYGSMVFVTFTYRPDTIPFSCSIETIDKNTGEFYLSTPGTCLNEKHDIHILSHLRCRYDSVVKYNKPYYFRSRFYEDDDKILQYCYTPSIKREDFRLWLKRERVYYKRKYGKGLPPFSYLCVGEYGPNTVRPHMHACFMGLSYVEVCRICESWRRDFGFVYVENVNCINLDGTSGFVRAARYVAKYLYKGKFDNPASISRRAEKGRTICSIGLGTDLDQNEKDYLLCKDVFGPLDFHNVSRINGDKLTKYELQYFALEFARRSVVCLDGTYFRLSRAVVRRLFYDCFKTYASDGKLDKIEYQASPLRYACSTIVQDNFLRNYYSKFESSYREFVQRKDFTSLRSAMAFAASCKDSEEASREVSFQRSIFQSKF